MVYLDSNIDALVGRSLSDPWPDRCPSHYAAQGERPEALMFSRVAILCVLCIMQTP